MKGYSYLFALVFLLLNSITATSIFVNSTTDQEALVAFKNSITSDPDGILSNNWTNDSPLCHWIGVSCGIKHQRVTALNISRFGLGGTVAPHLGNLTFLRYLDISHNNFTGSIPSELSKLRRLKWIDLGVNTFTGQVPSWLGTLPQLERLYLRNNTFSSRIPPSFFNNSKLQFLSMRFNILSGNIPEEIGNSSSLKGLYLDYNQLSGYIPYGIFNISSMIEIYVMYNSLTGRLPSNMCNNIPNLKRLALSANQLSGQISSNIYKCRDLEILGLSINHFNCNIPSEVGSLSMLRELYLGVNDFKGGIPAEIGNLSSLETLHLSGASLTGRIPKEIGHLTFLEELSLINNNLEVVEIMDGPNGNNLENYHHIPLLRNFFRVFGIPFMCTLSTCWFPDDEGRNLPLLEGIPEFVRLVNYKNFQWTVQTRLNSEGQLILTNGWTDFVIENTVRRFEVLIFKHVAIDLFRVHIFGVDEVMRDDDLYNGGGIGVRSHNVIRGNERLPSFEVFINSSNFTTDSITVPTIFWRDEPGSVLLEKNIATLVVGDRRWNVEVVCRNNFVRFRRSIRELLDIGRFHVDDSLRFYLVDPSELTFVVSKL